MTREGLSQKPSKMPYHEANNITFEGAVGQSRLIAKDNCSQDFTIMLVTYSIEPM